MNFNEITENASLLKAIESMGFTEPSQIQEEAIPPVRAGRDILAQSQTGTGKTAAFAIPVIENLNSEAQNPQAMVVCPTRELAVQVAEEFKKLAKFDRDISVAALFGGENIVKQIKALKNRPQVVVGTPGRMRDHIRRKTLKLDEINCIILDEADEMLKMGFAEEIREIYEQVPGETQNLMFSATIPKNVEKLSREYLKTPQIIKIEPKNVASETVVQTYMAVQKKHKRDACVRVLDHKNPKKCIIFCNTKRMVDELFEFVEESGYAADRIHGDLKQEQRSKVLARFNRGTLDVLIATDIAGRGIDIKNVDLVINYDIPDEEDSYVHRIGRSGRAGKEGEAVSLVTGRDKKMLEDIESYIGRKIKYERVPSQAEVDCMRLNHLLIDCCEENKGRSKGDYVKILADIQAQGYSLEDLTIALLEERLNLSAKKEGDYNDYSYFESNKDGGNRRRSGGNRRNSGGGNRRRSGGGNRRRSGSSNRNDRRKGDRNYSGKRNGNRKKSA